MSAAQGPPAILDPGLDPLFWDNLRPTTPSAWHGHVPFAHWLVTAIQPRSIVELGTHAGVSYAAFCQAVQRSGLDTHCSAVDSWAGDDHAGAYTEDVFTELQHFHDARFGSFSRMVRATFDEALGRFADGSIDLLHIDGFHTYEAVSHDFHSWRPKLSDRAVVLFHDTHVRVRGFGVWRFWDEIRGTGTASLAFEHAFGLGVLALGTVPPALAALCHAPVDLVRQRFATLGQMHVLTCEQAHKPAGIPDEAPDAAPPLVDATLDAGQLFIAERFVGPPGLHAVALPRDAVSRDDAGCAVWIVAPDGQDWRQGIVMPPASGEVATLVFAPFNTPNARHFHVFVTAQGPVGAGLPQALADLLGSRRPPIALDTPDLAGQPSGADGLGPRALMLWAS